MLCRVLPREPFKGSRVTLVCFCYLGREAIISIRVGEEETDGRQEGGNVDGGRPGPLRLGLEGVEADAAPFVNVGVVDWRKEAGLGGFKRIARGDFQFELKDAGFVRGAFGSLDACLGLCMCVRVHIGVWCHRCVCA